MVGRCAVVAASGMIGRMHVQPRYSDTDVRASELAEEWLKVSSQSWRGRWQLLLALWRPGKVAEGEETAPQRMGLGAPASWRERVQRRLLRAAWRRHAREGQEGASV